MQIDILTVVPELLESAFAHSIMKRALQKGLLQVNVHNLRAYTPLPRQQVDDYAFGGGAGMVMMIEPLVNAIESLKSKTTYNEVIYLTPDGDLFNQHLANQLSLKQNLLPIRNANSVFLYQVLICRSQNNVPPNPDCRLPCG
jgi:tRNA (guanine37-N1)-methyltransferase